MYNRNGTIRNRCNPYINILFRLLSMSVLTPSSCLSGTCADGLNCCVSYTPEPLLSGTISQLK